MVRLRLSTWDIHGIDATVKPTIHDEAAIGCVIFTPKHSLPGLWDKPANND